jgi:hypothetical protein
LPFDQTTWAEFNDPVFGVSVQYPSNLSQRQPTQSSITSIPNLNTVGTISSGTWSGSFGAVSGVNLTNLNASNLASGTVPSARLTGTYAISVSGNAATASNAIGVGQSWTNVAGSRSLDITYTNSTGRSIAINITIIANVGGTPTSVLFVNSLIAGKSTSVTLGGSVCYSAIIPNGSTYRIFTDNSAQFSVEQWIELR